MSTISPQLVEPPAPPLPPFMLLPGPPLFNAEQGPQGTWVVRQYALADAIFKAPSAFSQEYGDPSLNVAYAAMWAADGDHPGTRHYDLRSPLADLFRPSAFFWIRPQIAEIAHGVLDECAGAPTIEFVGQVGGTLLLRVMNALLQTDPGDGRVYREWVEEHVRTQLDQAPLPQEGPIRYCSQLVQARREQPRFGLVDWLIELHDQGHPVAGAPMSDLDLYGYIWSFIIAGTETTVSSLAAALLYLSSYRGGVLTQLQANRQLIPAAVRETLRLVPAFPFMYYVVKERVALAGTAFEPGQAVLVSLAAVNRDPAVFPDPLALDLQRPAVPRHRTFGGGIHRCLGEHLAQLVMEVALSVLLSRWETVSWNAALPVTWVAGMVNRMERVSFDVTWRGAPRAATP